MLDMTDVCPCMRGSESSNFSLSLNSTPRTNLIEHVDFPTRRGRHTWILSSIWLPLLYLLFLIRPIHLPLHQIIIQSPLRLYSVPFHLFLFLLWLHEISFRCFETHKLKSDICINPRLITPILRPSALLTLVILTIY